MSVWAIGISVGLSAYGIYSQKKASKAAAEVDMATADYNARLDESMAQQLDLDTKANVATMRAENEVYLSRQAASYATAGVLANSGSALDAQILNAGKLEQRVQQTWVDSLRKQDQYYSAGKIGRLEGDAQAKADKAMGTLALINGGAKIAGTVYGGYQNGTFGSSGSGAGAQPS